ncbi:MAG TPA: sulfite exporter TauE/SafE family protein [Nitrospirota bacterium]
MPSSYIEIFVIGLLGSMHCIGMCGGFVAMYSLKRPLTGSALPYHLLYNLGRVTTYSLLGGILGSIGSFAAYAGEHRGIPGAVLLIAGFMMILMGLNIAGVLGKRGLFEDAGIAESSHFRRMLHAVLELESVWSTFLLGLLLGLLPCGLLYPIFMNAAASGGFLPGMLTMAAFGLGTAPAMLSFGYLVARLRPHLKLFLYRIAAILIILLGGRALLRGMAFNGWIAHGRFW